MKHTLIGTGVLAVGLLAFVGGDTPVLAAAAGSLGTNTVTLTASQPLLRTGQMVTLYATSPEPLGNGQELAIVDETTGQTVASATSGSSVSATWSNNSAVTQNFQAIMTQDSKVLPIEWSDVGTGDNRGYANAAGDTVSLSAPLTDTADTPITLTASPSGFKNPVYQFWYALSGGSWVNSGAFSSNASYTFTPPSGIVDVLVYARESSAPSNETATERATYEAKSDTSSIAVAAGTSTTGTGTGSTTGSGSGSGSTGTGSTGTGSTGTGSTGTGSSGSGSTGSGGTGTSTNPNTNAWVGLSTINQVAVGDGMQFTANAVGMTNPEYQFWFLSPSNQWESSGSYSLSNTFNLTATTQGDWDVVVYARPESAPANETTAERAATTVESPTMEVAVHP